jgi:hypothetical protein
MMHAVNHPIHRLLIEGARKGPKAHREAVKTIRAIYHESCHFVMNIHEGLSIVSVGIGIGAKAGSGDVWFDHPKKGRRADYWQHAGISAARASAAGVVYETWAQGGYFERAIAAYNPKNQSNDVNSIKIHLGMANLDVEENFWPVLNDTEWKLNKLWPVIEFVAGAIQVGRKGQTFKPTVKFQKMVAEFIKYPEKLRAHAPWAFYYIDVPYDFLEELELVSSETEYPDEEFAQYTDRVTRAVAGADISVPIRPRDILNPSPQRLSA